MAQSILITGGAGFVGSNLALQFKEAVPNRRIIALDNLKRRGAELNLPRLREAGIEFLHGDIRHLSDFDPIEGPIDVLIDASAEPSVLAGLDGLPHYVIETNLQGTINCLNLATKHGADVVFLSTSRIYPIAYINQLNYEETDTRFELEAKQSLPGASEHGIAEGFPIAGKARSLYGSSKLAAELFVEEYREFFGLRTVINRCGVLAGPWQMGKLDQGVVGLWLARHVWPKPLKYIGFGGTGKQVRDLLHIRDLGRLLEMQLGDMKRFNGQCFNVGGGTGVSLSLREMTGLCQDITGNQIKIAAEPETRPADIPIYITDHRRVTDFCGWQPEVSAKQLLAETFAWMREHEASLKPLLG